MRYLVWFGLALLAAPVLAQDPPPPEKPFKFTSDLSFVNTGGNTDVLTLGLSDKVEWKTARRFLVRQEFRWDYGETEGEKSANALLLGLRGEYLLTSRLSLFAGVVYDYNLFAGVKRHFAETVGLGFLALDAARDKLRLEVGVSANQEWELLQNSANNFTTGRLAGDYKHLFGEKAYFQQIVEYIPNFDQSADYRFNTETALVAPITGGVAIKIGYVVRYRGEPPEGFGTTDTTFRTGIQITN
jgi:putative salt-induced outer membrane protein YdiY